MFNLILCLNVLLRAVAGGVGSVSEASDLVTTFGHEFEFIKPHQPLPLKFLRKLSGKPADMIRSYSVDNILMGNFEVRLSHYVYKSHFEGTPPTTYNQKSLITSLGEANIEMPKDLLEWSYGTTRLLRTTHPVEMQILSRTFKNGKWDNWDNIVSVEQSLMFKVTRYQGKKLGKGKYGKDIMFIEAIQYPAFKRGAVSGLEIVEKPVIYGNVPTWKVPTAFVDMICEIRGSEKFINDHVLGNTGPDYSRAYLFVLPRNTHILLLDADIKALKFETPGTVRTRANDIIIGHERDVTNGRWVPTRMQPRQIVFNAIKFRNPQSDHPVLVLTGWHGVIAAPKKVDTPQAEPLIQLK